MMLLRFWLACAAATVLIAFSVAFLDRPIALFAHNHPSFPALLTGLTRIPEVLGGFAIVGIVGLGIWRATYGSLGRMGETGFLASLAIIVAEAIKTSLKLAFGRAWPETWVNNNPSFIRDGVYGFFPFHGGPGYASFPSGHTTVVTAAMVVLWLRVPRFRPIFAAAIGATVIGLLGMDYHFFSDIFAGFCLGAATAWMTVRIAT